MDTVVAVLVVEDIAEEEEEDVADHTPDQDLVQDLHIVSSSFKTVKKKQEFEKPNFYGTVYEKKWIIF